MAMGAAMGAAKHGRSQTGATLIEMQGAMRAMDRQKEGYSGLYRFCDGKLVSVPIW